MIISNFSNRNSNILKRVSILHFLLVKISFLPLWFNIILSSFSQLCLLLPLRVFPSGIFELFSIFFFHPHVATFFDYSLPFSPLPSFLMFSRTLILLYRLYRRNYFFSPFLSLFFSILLSFLALLIL